MCFSTFSTSWTHKSKLYSLWCRRVALAVHSINSIHAKESTALYCAWSATIQSWVQFNQNRLFYDILCVITHFEFPAFPYVRQRPQRQSLHQLKRKMHIEKLPNLFQSTLSFYFFFLFIPDLKPLLFYFNVNYWYKTLYLIITHDPNCCHFVFYS